MNTMSLSVTIHRIYMYMSLNDPKVVSTRTNFLSVLCSIAPCRFFCCISLKTTKIKHALVPRFFWKENHCNNQKIICDYDVAMFFIIHIRSPFRLNEKQSLFILFYTFFMLAKFFPFSHLMNALKRELNHCRFALAFNSVRQKIHARKLNLNISS
jgi:hypothetical protein